MHRVYAACRHVVHTLLGALLVIGLGTAALRAQDLPSGNSVQAVPGMPPVVDPRNVYSEIRANNLSPAVAGALPRVYVPNRQSNDVAVIDPATFKVVDRFRAGVNPQHVIPSWDLKTLWVNNNAEGRKDGSVTPIDPKTGKPGKSIAVDDPYNMYFTPDGSAAIVVAEARKRLDFRDPQTMAFKYSISVPKCRGINHTDFSVDGRYAIFTCEFAGMLAKIDLVQRKVVGYLKLSRGGMPQDIRISPDGQLFYIADMKADGLFLVDGPHGGKGSVSVIDFATRKLVSTWPIPGGGSPDMGNMSVDGKTLWLSSRFDDAVYAIETATGKVTTISVKKEPHGLCVWPQPGRYSLGHTGNMR